MLMTKPLVDSLHLLRHTCSPGMLKAQEAFAHLQGRGIRRTVYCSRWLGRCTSCAVSLSRSACSAGGWASLAPTSLPAAVCGPSCAMWIPWRGSWCAVLCMSMYFSSDGHMQRPVADCNQTQCPPGISWGYSFCCDRLCRLCMAVHALLPPGASDSATVSISAG